MEPSEAGAAETSLPARDDRSMHLLELGLALVALATVALLTMVR